MFIINIVYSEGLLSGREVVPVIGSDMYEVIDRAYEHYKGDFKDYDGLIDGEISEELSLSEFSDIMKQGFIDDDEFVLIQCFDFHIQYEPTAWH